LEAAEKRAREVTLEREQVRRQKHKALEQSRREKEELLQQFKQIKKQKDTGKLKRLAASMGIDV